MATSVNLSVRQHYLITASDADRVVGEKCKDILGGIQKRIFKQC